MLYKTLNKQELISKDNGLRRCFKTSTLKTITNTQQKKTIKFMAFRFTTD